MALDLTIHEKTLRRYSLSKQDFVNYPHTLNPDDLQKTLNKAYVIGQSGFTNIKLSSSKIGNKAAYKIKNLEDELVLRLISKNIRRLTKVIQSNRVSNIKCIKSLLEEGVDYRIYKLDIKSFYESVCVKDILQKFERDSAFSRQSFNLLSSFFEIMGARGVIGLPRGISISANLAEFVMRGFDRYARSHAEVFHYSRYVDDILIVTSSRENENEFVDELSSHLPTGLIFNNKKKKILTLNEKTGENVAPKKLDFLGYSFRIEPRVKVKSKPIAREVILDISESKTKKIKTRIIKSILQFNKDGDYPSLLARIKLLSGNYSVYDHARSVHRKAGIYFNYKLLDQSHSSSLPELDAFLSKMFLNSEGRICRELHRKLDNHQRRNILALSFSRGFQKRVFYNYSATQLADLMRCWRYE